MMGHSFRSFRTSLFICKKCGFFGSRKLFIEQRCRSFYNWISLSPIGKIETWFLRQVIKSTATTRLCFISCNLSGNQSKRLNRQTISELPIPNKVSVRIWWCQSDNFAVSQGQTNTFISTNLAISTSPQHTQDDVHNKWAGKYENTYNTS